MKRIQTRTYLAEFESNGGNLKRVKPPRTRMLDVFEALQTDILQCVLRPGARLRLKDLQDRYACGLSPLREALMRLVSDGLVVLEDRKGFCVAPVSQEEVLDLTMIRSELESFAIRKAIEKGDDRWEANLLARAHELSKRSMTTDHGTIDVEWENRHKAFHQALYAACGSAWLIYLCGLLFDRASRYRRLSVQMDRAHRDVVKEHSDLLRAAIDRDAATAERLLREHLTLTTNLILSGPGQTSAASKNGHERRPKSAKA